MESSLCLRYGPLPTLPLRIPSPVKPTRLTKPHKSFTLSSLPLTNTNNSIYRPPRHGSSLVCAINGFPKPSTNDGCWEITPQSEKTPSKSVCHPSGNCPNNRDDGKKIERGSVGASLALACVLGIISCGCTMMSPIAIADIVKNQKSPSMIHIYPKGGRVALKSLLDMSVYLSSSQGKHRRSVKSVLTSWKSKRLSFADVETLKEDAMRLMKHGKGDEAVKLLEKAYKDCNRDSEPEFYVEMALVEVLIYLGRYEDALKCNCLFQRDAPSDARVPLYKAIIYTMLDKKSAKTHWKEFVSAIEGEGIPDPRGLGD